MDAYEQAIEYARERGEQDGTNAAGWYIQDAFGGRVTRGAEESARRILQGIEDGDPEITDGFPYADLSGEWADRLTGPELVDDAISAAGIDHDDGDDDVAAHQWFAEICEAYEAAFDQAAP